jgi:hypothetical protein
VLSKNIGKLGLTLVGQADNGSPLDLGTSADDLLPLGVIPLAHGLEAVLLLEKSVNVEQGQVVVLDLDDRVLLSRFTSCVDDC